MNPTRRRFCVLLSLLLLVLVASGAAETTPKTKYLMFVGTYTDKSESKGIYSYQYDSASGDVKAQGLAAETANPSFLAVDPSHRFLYAVNELTRYKDEPSGGVSAFVIDRQTGKLTFLDEVASRGADPCYISFDRTGKYALVANYAAGNVAVFPIHADGSLGEASSVVRDQGTPGPNKERQEGPHAHWIETSAGNREAYVADLGLDRVLIYKFDATKGTLDDKPGEASPVAGAGSAAPRPSAPGNTASSDFHSLALSPGTGPRHVAFSANEDFMYVLGELDSSITVFAHAGQEAYRHVQSTSALPIGLRPSNEAAEIAIHPNGRFLYASNRGHDTIDSFLVDGNTGKLTFFGDYRTEGKTPRHFAIDPTGTRLFVANQDSGNIAIFRIDPETGSLTRTGPVLQVPSPVCIKFLPAE